MSIPINLGNGWPSDDWEDLMDAITLSSSLSDQLGDTLMKREPEGVENIKINPLPGDTLGITLEIIRQEVAGLKVENAQLINVVRSLESANQVLTAKLKTLVQEKNDKPRDNKG